MKRQLLSVLFTLLLLPLNAAAELRVFSCEPEWAALVTELAGDHAEVSTATTAQQDPHYIQARPSLIAQMRRADLVVCTGAELEVGWLPVLMARGGNPKVKPGAEGYFEAANYVPMLEVPQRLDRSEGDIHSRGNPHIQLDPRNIQRIATALGERLAKLDPAGRLPPAPGRFHLSLAGGHTTLGKEAEPLKGCRSWCTTGAGSISTGGWV
jgi:zinc/manganese transport system substrate-binding protein